MPVVRFGLWLDFADTVPADDRFEIAASDDGGESWALIEIITIATEGWKYRTVALDPVSAPTEIRLRFTGERRGWIIAGGRGDRRDRGAGVGLRRHHARRHERGSTCRWRGFRASSSSNGGRRIRRRTSISMVRSTASISASFWVTGPVEAERSCSVSRSYETENRRFLGDVTGPPGRSR